MKMRTLSLASAGVVLLLALGYALLGGARGWLEPVEAAIATVAGVNHPLMFAEGSLAARIFNIFAIVAGLALRVFLFASVTLLLLRKRLDVKKTAHSSGDRTGPRVCAVPRAKADWLEVSRN